MKKLYWMLLVGAVIIFAAIFSFYFFIKINICLDKGGSETYFSKNYFLDNYDLFYNNTNFPMISKENIIASYSESSRCSDRGKYYISSSNGLKRVNKEEFDKFIKDYNDNCSDCLLNRIGRLGPSGIFEASSRKPVCGAANFVNMSECIEIKPLINQQITIKNNFGSKIVYEPIENLTLSDYQKDCTKRGGTFNECGSVCGPDAEICVMMCAFTCEDLK